MLKIFSLIVAIVLCVFVGFSFSACNENDRLFVTSETTENDVAILTIFAYDGKGESKFGLMNLGHSFLSIENISEENFTLQGMEIAPGETYAIGTWSIVSHFGIWFNVESSYITKTNKYDGRVSLSIGIDSDDIETLRSFMASHDKWTPIHNCSYFAFAAWNTVADENEKIDKPALTYTPNYVANFIKKFDNFETNREINNDQNLMYFDGEKMVEYVLSPKPGQEYTPAIGEE